MTPYRQGLIALPTLLLMAHVVSAKPPPSADVVRPPVVEGVGVQPDVRPAPGDDPVRTTYLAPADPDQPQPGPRAPPDADQPVARELYAVLPDPLNGWVMVDRAVAHAAPGQPLPPPTGHFARPVRVQQSWRIGPTAVRMVPSDG